MKIIGISFLTTISRDIQCRPAEGLPSLDMNAFRSALKCIFVINTHAGFTITQINRDNKYCPHKDEMIHEHGITMIFAHAQDHVP